MGWMWETEGRGKPWAEPTKDRVLGEQIGEKGLYIKRKGGRGAASKGGGTTSSLNGRRFRPKIRVANKPKKKKGKREDTTYNH